MTFETIPYAPEKKQYDRYPDMVITKGKHYTATIKTNKGDITLTLFADTAPKTVNSFVFLSKAGFYDNVIFHRVIPDFVIQGGDPKGVGIGGPGYTFADEFTHNMPKIQEGTLAMANAGPNTNGSQFFICLTNLPHLDGKHTPFGQVIKGMEVVVAIVNEETDLSDKPVTPVVMKTIVIDEK